MVAGVFCFYCEIFSNKQIGLTTNGYSDWKNAHYNLGMHAKSVSHLHCFKQWNELILRLKCNKTIDCVQQKMLDEKAKHWRNVLERIFSVIQLHATQNLALRGTTDKLYQPDNGNFLKVLETWAKFDPVLKEHFRQIQNKELHNHYLGKNIQNEIIQIMSRMVKNEITTRLKASKYFSIIVDCTPDVSHTEQMTLIVRFVSILSSPIENGNYFKINEHFLNFVDIYDSTGAGMSEKILDVLEKNNLDMDDLRGQGYDNGANMRGIHNGVQSRILNLKPRALFIPCVAHTLNLVVNDAVHCCTDAVTFFDTVPSLFLFFSGSTTRWEILTKCVDEFTLKPLSETRWSSRIDALKPIRRQIKNIVTALQTFTNISEQSCVMTATIAKNKSLAENLIEKIVDFKFLACLVLWYDILYEINITSKALQSVALNTSQAVDLLQKSIDFRRSYRTDRKFNYVLEKAKEMAIELQIEPKFKLKRFRRKKTFFGYEGQDEPLEDETRDFKVNFYNMVLDHGIESLSRRFELIVQHNEQFKFLYNLEDAGNDADLMKKCKKLEKLLTDKDQKDIIATDLFDEIRYISSHCEELKPEKVLNFICKNRLTDSLPNVFIAMRILLTLSVTVASGERSFSK